MKLYEFTVEGIGEFPFDMLRYDQCWPKHESPDSTNLGKPVYYGGSRQVRQVTLVSIKMDPTMARWESYGWKVVK